MTTGPGLEGRPGPTAARKRGRADKEPPARHGLAPIDGVIDYVSEDFLGVRSADALYRFIYGFNGAVVLGHHLFGAPGQPAPDAKDAEQAWQTWLAGVFA